MLDQKNNETFTITDKKMTRFSITLNEGIVAVDWAIKNCIGGEIVVPKYHLRSVNTYKSISPNRKVKIIGIRHGEKIHEEMIVPSDSRLTVDIKKYYLIAPDLEIKKN